VSNCDETDNDVPRIDEASLRAKALAALQRTRAS
jgi:hypothetical protein